MSGMRFTIKKGDTRPALQIRCLKPDGTPFPLTGLTLVFNMGKQGQTRKVDGGACTVINEEGGVVEYPWVVADTDTAGEYRAEFVATAGAIVYSFPNDGYITVEVMDEV